MGANCRAVTALAHGLRHRTAPGGPDQEDIMRISRVTVTALLGSAALAAPATAMPTDPPHGQSPPIVQTASPSGEPSAGFDWDSAGIGAAGGVGAVAIALAAAGGMRRRRPRGPVITYTPTQGDPR
jgi:hypothetical protein